MKQIGIVTTAYNLPEATRELFESAVSEKYLLRFYLYLHSREADVVEVCEQIGARGDVRYFDYGINRGLSRSWNDGLMSAWMEGADAVLIVNDDVVFGAGDIDKLADAALSNPDKYLVTGEGFNVAHGQRMSIGYSCFVLNWIAMERLGFFDENIFPIYFEDCDYQYRARLAGLESITLEDTELHHGGSQSLREGSGEYRAQHHQTFTLNKLYYKRKWGGPPENEIYTKPFDDDDLNIFIGSWQRHKPYGEEYDRTDQEVVKV